MLLLPALLKSLQNFYIRHTGLQIPAHELKVTRGYLRPIWHNWWF